MRILIVTPASRRSRKGNRVTADRWGRLLRRLGNRVAVSESYRRQPADLLIALHARRSAPSVAEFRRANGRRPIVLAMTGTDLYQDLAHSHRAHQSVATANRLVLLQPHGLQELPPEARRRARVIFQSAEPPKQRCPPLKHAFEVAVVGNLRSVKDPFRAALAARRLPNHSRVRVTHLGAALTVGMKRRAEREMDRNPRYRWLGDRPHWQTRRILARSRLLVVTSKLEGGANVVSEALAAGVPVISSHISGSIGMLGPDYAGFYPVGETRALAELLRRCEEEPTFLRKLRQACARRRHLVRPEREIREWKKLLAEL